MTQREKFELTMARILPSDSFRRTPDGDYQYWQADRMWKTWQAAIASTVERGQ